MPKPSSSDKTPIYLHLMGGREYMNSLISYSISNFCDEDFKVNNFKLLGVSFSCHCWPPIALNCSQLECLLNWVRIIYQNNFDNMASTFW